MIQTFFGALLFLFAAIWETHITSFLPSWALIYPLWPLTVVCLCLESDRIKLAIGLIFALVWQEIARPLSVPPLFWLWLPLMALASWLLRIWLSHRSMWSAIVLAMIGRSVWVMARAIDLRAFHPDGAVWKAQAWQWGTILLWDIVLVVIFLQIALFLSRRLSPYLPRFLHRDRV